MKKQVKKRVSPCSKCKGFDIPGRREKSVARDSKGRFKVR